MGDNGEPKEPSLKDTIAVAVACVALTGFGVLVLALLFQLDLPEVSWSRAAFLLNGVEAVAFAAAGYLFGREVNRGRAEAAEDRAKSEEKRAEEVEKKGQTLANAVQDVVGTPPPRSFAVQSTQDDVQSTQGLDPRQMLSRLAADLFPPKRLEERR